jgi:subtilase-type serine protease
LWLVWDHSVKNLLLGAVALSTLAVSIAAPGAARAQAYQEGVQQWELAMINARAAYDRGYTGAGVTVAVVDTGMQMDHPDLMGQLSPFSLDGVLGGGVTYDINGHGTHVAGTIAAARNGLGTHGVAFDARLAPLRLLADNGFMPDDPMIVADLYNFALDSGVRLFNNSWGGGQIVPASLDDLIGAGIFSSFEVEAYRRAARENAVMVWATGNSTQMQPSFQSGLPGYIPELQPHWLAVTAVNSQGVLASYANRCGEAAEWCLAAPGGDATPPGGSVTETQIISSYPGGLIGSLYGTSMAAPQVTGAVAIAMQMYPNARAAELTRLTLATATDIGDPGVDAVYGWGLLNIANLAATRDAEAASVFAGGLWSAHESQTLVADVLAARTGNGDGPAGWISVAGRQGGYDAGPGAPGADNDAVAVVGGFDMINTGRLLFGVALGRSLAEFDETGLDNSGEVKAATLAVYGGLTSGRLFGEAAAGVDARDYEFRRGDVVGSAGTVLEDTVTGRVRVDGSGAFASARAGVAFQTTALTIRPYAYGRVAHQQIDGLREVGADIFNLAAEDQSSTRSEVGPGVQLVLNPRPMSGGTMVRADLDLRHGFVGGDDDFAFETSMLGSPVPGRLGELGDVTTLSGGAAATFTDYLEASFRFTWSEADRADAFGLSAGLRFTF